MSTKILVADDSLTIQKVINITLSALDYEVKECYDEQALFKTLKKDKFDIILLDFNLSDDRSIYDLCSEIRKQDNVVKIMAMMGTFDSIDNGEAQEVQLDDYIVKPFESAKFINKLRTLTSADAPIEQLTDSDEDDLVWGDDAGDILEEDIDEKSLASEVEQDSSFGDWQVEAPSVAKEEEEESAEASINDMTAMGMNLLKEELSGWGVEVPGVIGENESSGAIPPIIDDVDPTTADPKEEGTGITTFVSPKLAEDTPVEEKVEEPEEDNSDIREFRPGLDLEGSSVEEEDQEEDLEMGEVTGNIDISEMDLESEPQMVPEDNDLAYPGETLVEEEIEFQDNNADDDLEEKLAEDLSTRLISLDDLNIEEEDKLTEDQLDITEDEIDISKLQDDTRGDLVKDIEDEIGPDDFWAADATGPIEKEVVEDSTEDDEEEEFQVPTKQFEGNVANNFSRSIEEAQKALAEIESEPVQTMAEKNEVPNETSNDDINFNIDKESFKKNLSSQQTHETIAAPVIDEERIISTLKESLKEMIEETVKQYCSESVEKVAWEVIPDLAENIIKKELDEIAQSVKSSTDS